MKVTVTLVCVKKSVKKIWGRFSMAEDEVFRIYNVKIKNQQGQVEERKTIDALSLLQWLEMKEMVSSVLTIDLDKIPAGKGVDYVQAKVSTANALELKLLLQDMLGMLDKQEDQVQEDEGVEVAEPIKKKPQPQPQRPAQPQPQKSSQPQRPPSPEELFDDESNELGNSDDFSDDEITL